MTKAPKFTMKNLPYVVIVDGRVHSAFSAFGTARDYAATIEVKMPHSEKLMDVCVVDTGHFNQVVFRTINGERVI